MRLIFPIWKATATKGGGERWRHEETLVHEVTYIWQIRRTVAFEHRQNWADSVWLGENYFPFLTFNFLKMRKGTLRATFESPEPALLPWQPFLTVSLAWNILPQHFGCPCVALGLGLNALDYSRRPFCLPRTGLGSHRCFLNSCFSEVPSTAMAVPCLYVHPSTANLLWARAVSFITDTPTPVKWLAQQNEYLRNLYFLPSSLLPSFLQ